MIPLTPAGPLLRGGLRRVVASGASMARRRTRGEAHIEALLSNLDPGSERYHVLRAARDFKASWVELGERLTETREQEKFKEWGYTSF